MRLDDEQYEFIKGEVVALFERYDVHGIPINGFELAYKMGIILVPYSSLNEKSWLPQCVVAQTVSILRLMEMITFTITMLTFPTSV